ncbi:hypothetical protein KY343_03955 [Candidatus Woesearchaeota archaeon]|nr:hypothetical protein [Candidatus Woesearchaeota archaeon]
MEEKTLQLGGNIELSGFSELEPSIMIVLKKIVGNYVRRMSDKCKGFEKLTVTMKTVHAREKGEKYELHAKMIENGKSYTSSYVDRNLFIAVDSSLKAIINSLE